MTEQNPAIFIQAGSHPAEDVRRYIETVTADTEGIVDSAHLLVDENGTPNMSVDVAAGRCFVLGTEATFQGTYFCENRASVNKAIAASDPTNPRIDLVVAKIQDANYSGATNAWSIAVVTGTPNASPSAPSMPNNSLLLATIAVAATVTTIVDANITDNRVLHNPHYDLVKFTSTGAFVKADYPWAKAVRVRAQAGGGGGGGTEATGSGEQAAGGGGGAGGYSEKRILISALSSSETVTVGAAGAGAASGNNAGGNGGNSSFGSHAQGSTGTGGSGAAANTPANMFASPGQGGGASGGDVNIPGGWGTTGVPMVNAVGRIVSSIGGDSQLGRGGFESYASGVLNGDAGTGFGSGGAGACADQSEAAGAGGAGTAGIVIVEIFG